jgi:hypothetical protein
VIKAINYWLIKNGEPRANEWTLDGDVLVQMLGRNRRETKLLYPHTGPKSHWQIQQMMSPTILKRGYDS